MKEQKGETGGKVYDYTSIQGQIRVHGALILAITLLLVIGSIHYHSLYLEMMEKYQLMAESNRVILEQYQEMLQLIQETSGLIQKILDVFENSKSILEEIPLYLQVDQIEKIQMHLQIREYQEEFDFALASV